MEQEPKKQDEDELTDEDLDGVSGGVGSFEQPTRPPRVIVPDFSNTTPKLPSGAGS